MDVRLTRRKVCADDRNLIPSGYTNRIGNPSRLDDEQQDQTKMGDRAAAVRCLQQAYSKGGTPDAEGQQLTYQLLSSAAISDPTMAKAWIELGRANTTLGVLHGAVAAYRRALELPDGPGEYDMNRRQRGETLTGLGYCLQRIGRTDEAMDALFAALEIDETLALAWLNLSLCKATEGDMEGAVRYGQRGYELDPTNPAVEMGLSFALLFSGYYAEGLKHFEARFPYKLRSFLSYPFPKWHGEPGKDVFLVGDQGIGDTLSFSRFVETAARRAKFIHMAVQPELVRLFAASFQHITNINIVALPCPWPPAEVWTTFVSLPYCLGLTDDEIINAPNIDVPNFQAPSTQWKSPDRKLHIGVCWAGSKANDIDCFRSFPLQHLLDLYRVPDIQLYSLQADDRAMELHSAGCAVLLRDLKPFIRDISDTIGILKHLDLVIGCESALGHICSLTGTEFWMAYSYHGRDYRVGFDGTRRLWTPKHRIFKQGKDATWFPVFDRITEALRQRVAGLEQREAAE